MRLTRSVPVAIDLCLIISFSQCVSDDLELIMKKWKLECVEYTKVDAELVLKLKTGDWNMVDLPLQKWALCMLNRAGLMTEQGVFLLDAAMDTVTIEERPALLEAIDKCLYTTRHLPHEIAWNYLKCYNAEKPTEFKLI